jgi:hypothetical protein
MRKSISRFTSSFAALLFDQVTVIDVDDRLESIRDAMLEALFDVEQKNVTQTVWNAIERAVEVQTLWYLRSDLLQLLADFWGEPVAREKLGEITKLFQGVVSDHQIRGHRLSKSQLSRDKKIPSTLEPVPEKLEEAIPVAAQVLAPVADATLSMVVEDNGLASLDGLDFVNAITAHQKWKVRLLKYANADSTEKLEYNVVCRDDQCELGKWINDRGGKDYGHFPVFSQLKMLHAQFHLEAGAIIRMVDEGNLKQAQVQIRQGNYARHSVKVQGLLSSLYVEITEVNGLLPNCADSGNAGQAEQKLTRSGD